MSKAFFETCIEAQRNDISELTKFTMWDCVQAIMAIDSINSARSFYDGYVEWIIDNTDVESRSEAESIARSNISFCYGEGMSPARINMWKEACSAEHPIFGVAMPTPEKTFAEGVKRGSMSKLDEIKERLSKATSGPWKASLSETDCNLPPRVACPNNRDCETCPHVYTIEGAWIYGPESVECGDYTYFNDADAELMAHAPEDIAYLLAEAERYKAVVEAHKAIRDHHEVCPNKEMSGYGCAKCEQLYQQLVVAVDKALAELEAEHE